MLCITHLPQVAAHAHAHFRVAKTVRDARTTISVVRLSGSRRIEELARMMGGDARTPGMRTSARELLVARSGEDEREEDREQGESETWKAKAKARRRK